jgi:hypothetical protein
MPRRVSCEIELKLAAPAAEVEKLERAILELRRAIRGASRSRRHLL